MNKVPGKDFSKYRHRSTSNTQILRSQSLTYCRTIGKSSLRKHFEKKKTFSRKKRFVVKRNTPQEKEIYMTKILPYGTSHHRKKNTINNFNKCERNMISYLHN
jgi:hypothetical protein